MGKIIFEEVVLEYFDKLVFTLFTEDYFSYPKSAQLYVDKIVDFIILEISSFPYRTTPKSLQYLGSNYIFYKVNKRTTWFVFFEKKNENFLITGILNNHSEEANVFNSVFLEEKYN